MNDHGSPPRPPHPHVPLVGLGGSAGSLSALQDFFRAVPPDSGLAFVVALHLAPTQQSNLATVLQYHAPIPVQQVTRTVQVAPDQIYVIAPGHSLVAADGQLQLRPLPDAAGPRVTIDILFRTLAQAYGPEAMAVVLSGMDGDGALGIQRVKELGGLCVAQDPAEAAYPSMPQSAIGTGMVDWVLRAADMPERLVAYVQQGGRLQLPSEEAPAARAEPEPRVSDNEQALREILAFLKVRSGRDFSYYKRATVLRRIARRMRVNAVDDLPGYLSYLHLHPGEAAALLQDILISVTNFFRDPEEFEALAQHIPSLFENKGPGDTLRIWVPACATGEEAYSLAILLHEHARTLEAPPAIQVFATDLDEQAIHTARRGLYPPTIAADVSPERLRRFFTQEAGGYCIRREIRDSVLFAMHDVLGDSPFSRVDLVSCRNLLIYLSREAQGRVLDVFHFALRAHGMLFLGNSESVEDGHDKFQPCGKRHHIYRSRSLSRTPPILPGTSVFAAPHAFAPRLHGEAVAQAATLARAVPDGDAGMAREQHPDRALSWSELHYQLLERLSPPSLIVSAQLEIVHVSASAGRYLQFSAGEPTRDVFRSIHPAFRLELRAAIYRALQSGRGTETPPLDLVLDGEPRRVHLRIAPGDGEQSGFVLVVFLEQPADAVPASAAEPPAAALQLEAELDRTRSQLRDVIERAEVSMEELKASNEELQAMNEELRSATEELETGREELLSLNEELTLVNSELSSNVDQLAQANNDLHNLMASTAIATVFLDRELRVKRYTPSAVELFSLIPSDVGRPLQDLNTVLDFELIRQDAAQALQLLTPAEREVQAHGRWFIARTVPYRTDDDRIAGVVLTFIDITERKRLDAASRSTSEQLRLIVENAHEYAIFSTDMERRVTVWNRGAERLLGFSAQDIIGQTADRIFTDEDRAAGVPEYEATTALREGRASDERWHVRRDGTRFWGSGVMMALRNDAGVAIGLVKIFRDQTEMRLALQALEESRNAAHAATQAKDRFLAVLSHELRTPLSPVLLVIDALSRRKDLPADAHGMLQMMRRNVIAQTRMIQDLLDITRIASGKLEIANQPLDLHETVHGAIEVCETQLLARQQVWEVALMAARTTVVGDADRLRQAVWNLLQNASKFSPVGGPITLRTHNPDADSIRIEVQDSGIGIEASARERIFDAFTQGDVNITRQFGGLGLGLAIVKAAVEAHGGRVAVHSEGKGHGARFEIDLPLASGTTTGEATA